MLESDYQMIVKYTAPWYFILYIINQFFLYFYFEFFKNFMIGRFFVK